MGVFLRPDERRRCLGQKHRRAISAKGPFPSRIFLSNLATPGGRWCLSAAEGQMAVNREAEGGD